jgi:hypothetical protein
MILEFSRQIFENRSNIKFHENPSNESKVAPFGRTDTHTDAEIDKQADIMKVIVALRNLTNARKNAQIIHGGSTSSKSGLTEHVPNQRTFIQNSKSVTILIFARFPSSRSLFQPSTCRGFLLFATRFILPSALTWPIFHHFLFYIRFTFKYHFISFTYAHVCFFRFLLFAPFWCTLSFNLITSAHPSRLLVTVLGKSHG